MNSQGQFSDSGNNQHPFISASYNLQDTPVSSHEKQESSTTPSENVSQSPYFQSQPTSISRENINTHNQRCNHWREADNLCIFYIWTSSHKRSRKNFAMASD
uniref:Uncharacterized protein n=1 Tax=Rhizophagus irregularis (strain DAOM 181602 / DAOM 197198 / MUCL 43194) TaxID=747089 RepID=U9TBA5_RHIID